MTCPADLGAGELLARLEAARFGASSEETLLALTREAEARLGNR